MQSSCHMRLCYLFSGPFSFLLFPARPPPIPRFKHGTWPAPRDYTSQPQRCCAHWVDWPWPMRVRATFSGKGDLCPPSLVQRGVITNAAASVDAEKEAGLPELPRGLGAAGISTLT